LLCGKTLEAEIFDTQTQRHQHLKKLGGRHLDREIILMRASNLEAWMGSRGGAKVYISGATCIHTSFLGQQLNLIGFFSLMAFFSQSASSRPNAFCAW
jgi:hypothetical protein